MAISTAKIMVKKYLAIFIMLLPSLLVIYFFMIIFLSPSYELNVNKFCNKLKSGTSYHIVISEAGGVEGAMLQNIDEEKSTAMLISKGTTYSMCMMEFRNERLIKKWIQIS